MFPANSRYHDTEIATYEAPDGREITYLRRSFRPLESDAVAHAEHAVVEGERLDNITARYLGDPEQFWRVADANHALHPEWLTVEIGRRLRIPLMSLKGG